VSFAFGASELNAALTRFALLRVIADRHLGAVDQVEAARAEFAAVNDQAGQLVARIDELSSREYREREGLAHARREQLEIQQVLEARVEDFVTEIDGLEAAESELVALLEPSEARVDRSPAALARAAARRSTSGLIRPADGPLTSDFGPRWGREHRGIDIGGSRGSPIVAAESGVVLRAERNTGYGNNVIIDHGNGFTTLYAHLTSLSVVTGQVVEQGRQIGSMGSTGSATGTHLHFEVRFGEIAVDPLPFLP
jgi:murein DD-endopeptidase MepM/ murein hydrolase activator NlpD